MKLQGYRYVQNGSGTKLETLLRYPTHRLQIWTRISPDLLAGSHTIADADISIVQDRIGAIQPDFFEGVVLGRTYLATNLAILQVHF